MKLRALMKIAVITSIVLLCTGFGVYSFFRLNAVENSHKFNLYTLVPQDAIAILETDRMADLVEQINNLSCSKDDHFLYISELFVYLKKYLHTLVEKTPHGLSKQMNKMLISFHKPDTPMNQVLYCTLGSGDYELIEAFIQKYCSSTFPLKYFDYKGEEISIYTMVDGSFLAAYFTSDFIAVSFQKRLIEEVIDASLEKKSLAQLSSFRTMYKGKHDNGPARVYIRMDSLSMGKTTDGIRPQTSLSRWMEFDLKFNENAIYCSGISHEVDSTQMFINALQKQKSLEGFIGENLPSSTFFYDRWAFSDKNKFFGFTARQEYAKVIYSDFIMKRDQEWISFLNEYGGESVMSCLFNSNDTLGNFPCAIISIPIKDVQEAESRLVSLLNTTDEEGDAPLPSVARAFCDYSKYSKAKGFKQYMLPRNTLLVQMTGITESTLYTYASFYKGNLLLAPDRISLSAYINALEGGEVMEKKAIYEESIGSLSPVYNFMMMVDMEEMLHQPETYVRLIPNFFFRQANFFRHFMLAVQFTCTDGVVYPNIVLLYKEEEL